MVRFWELLGYSVSADPLKAQFCLKGPSGDVLYEDSDRRNCELYAQIEATERFESESVGRTIWKDGEQGRIVRYSHPYFYFEFGGLERIVHVKWLDGYSCQQPKPKPERKSRALRHVKAKAAPVQIEPPKVESTTKPVAELHVSAAEEIATEPPTPPTIELARKENRPRRDVQEEPPIAILEPQIPAPPQPTEATVSPLVGVVEVGKNWPAQVGADELRHAFQLKVSGYGREEIKAIYNLNDTEVFLVHEQVWKRALTFKGLRPAAQEIFIRLFSGECKKAFQRRKVRAVG